MVSGRQSRWFAWSGVLWAGIVGVAAGLSAQEAQPAPRTIVVHVSTPAGKPAAGVPLVAGSLQAIGAQLDFTVATGSAVITDAQGRATLTVRPRAGGLDWPNLHVQADVVAEPPVRVPVPIEPTNDPVAVTLPPTGTVRVLVYDEDERPREGVRDVTLAAAGSRRFFDRLEVRGELEAEGSMFRWVALGQTLTVRASVAGLGRLQVERAGPTRAGELVVIDIRTNEQRLARVRVIDALGQPVPGRSLVAMLVTATRRDIFDMKTGPDGALTLRVPDEIAGVDAAQWLLVDPQRDGASAAVALDTPWLGVCDAGDIALAPGEVVAAGTVVDARGRPVAGLELEVPLSWRSGGKFTHQRSRKAHHLVVTDADGRFEVREHNPREGRVEARVAGTSFHLESAALTYGAVDQRLVAVRAGRMRIVLPELPVGTDARMLALKRRMRGPGSFGVPGGGERTTLPLPAGQASGSMLEFDGLMHGTYDLTLAGQAIDDPAVREIEVGEPADGEPEVVALAWQRFARRTTVLVVRPDGQSVRANLMSYRVSQGGFSGRGVSVGPEGASMLIPKGHRLVLQHPAWRTIEIRDPGDEVRFELEPRVAVELVLPEGVALPAGVRLQAMPEALAWLKRGSVELVTHGDQPLLIRADGVGPTEVTLSLPGDGGRNYKVVARYLVEIPEPAAEAEGVVRVPLPVTADDVRALNRR